MKVAIITQSYLETTLVLAKYLSQKGIEVDLYCINYIQTKNLFVFNFADNEVKKSPVDKNIIESKLSADLQDYFKEINLKFYFIKGGRISIINTLFEAVKIARIIKKQKYDLYHFIQGSLIHYLIAHLLPSKKQIFTLHEVTNHFGKTNFKSKLILNYICDKDIKTILHSGATEKRLIEYARSRNKQINSTVIYFGLFETYLYFKPIKPDEFIVPNKDIVLYYGLINPSKGVEFLIDTFRKFKDSELRTVHLVIAGNGQINTEIQNIERLTIINRYLTNEEIVYLNQIAKIVVCPHLSASQSGIPMTSFLFKKPIIGTSVGAFREIINDGVTGLIVQPNNEYELVNAITKLIRDKYLYNRMCENISNTFDNSDKSWKVIALKTLNTYKILLLNGQ